MGEKEVKLIIDYYAYPTQGLILLKLLPGKIALECSINAIASDSLFPLIFHYIYINLIMTYELDQLIRLALNSQ